MSGLWRTGATRISDSLLVPDGSAARVLAANEFFGGVGTVSSINAATMRYAGQAITTSAARLVSVTVGTMNYAGQTVATIRARTIAVIAAVMNYSPQPLGSSEGANTLTGRILSRLTEMRLFLGL